MNNLKEKKRLIAEELARIEKTRVKSSVAVNKILKECSSVPIDESVTLKQLIKRPELSYVDVYKIDPEPVNLPEDVQRQVEIQCTYEGYLGRQEAEIGKFKHLESITIPPEIDYCSIPGLSNEISQKLTEIKPVSLGQASRIPGITPAAISVLMVYVKRFGKKKS